MGRVFQGVFKAVLLLSVGISGQAQTARRIYADRANGVSFSYPANWVLNADDDAATAKLRIVTEGQPVAVVQLEGNFADEGPYKSTDFEAGAFAYLVTPRKSAEACFGALDPIAGESAQPMATTWNGQPARRLEARYGVAGTEDTHQIYATYRQGQCYLFETVIVSKDAGGPIRALPPARWKLIHEQTSSVMQSVRFSGKQAKKPL